MMRALIAAAATFWLFSIVAGCGQKATTTDYVARVGDQYLTQADISQQLARIPLSEDSLEARDQIIEQWVTQELLYREARQRGLRNDPDVQRALADNERSVMVSALVSSLYEESGSEFDEAELVAYFERTKDRLRLREPFLRLRYLSVEDPGQADRVRDLLQRTPEVDQDSVFRQAVDRYASNPELSLTLSDGYTAESRLFASMPSIRSALLRLQNGQVAPVVESDSLFHVVQLIERIPSGTIPEMEWVEEELTRRLLIQTRKQLYARQVQRLRNEALAREDLDIRR